ncbi:hypothetical protein QFZ78_005437 [Paenibacillus sp. V4I5]|nr:hypothetical protein [Paenibacillus sp. V4I5]
MRGASERSAVDRPGLPGPDAAGYPAFVAVVQEDLRNRVVCTGGISRLIPEPILKRLLRPVHKVVPALNPAVILDSKQEQGIASRLYSRLPGRDVPSERGAEPRGSRRYSVVACSRPGVRFHQAQEHRSKKIGAFAFNS